MESENLFNVSNKLHIECLRYCFGALIKEEIEITNKEWNEHRVRKQNCRIVLGGIPNELYHWPEKIGAIDCKKPVNTDHVRMLLNEYAKEPWLISVDFEELVNFIIPNNETLSTAEEAFNLYVKVLNIIGIIKWLQHIGSSFVQ